MLNNYKYVIRANQKMNWYLGFANTMNTYIDRVEHCSQNVLAFALHFNEKEHAEQFLARYFEANSSSVKEENKRFYEITSVPAEKATAGIFMYDVPCYFDKEAFKEWRKNPSKYSTKKAFK
ncbi:MAG: hypothetical protein IJZ79_02480 [Bacilli bacterium]|nr:hypothetical protein [Bacilli bacterium]MBQ8218592.1 hypothetical protein [Bacilli bacterium]